MRRSDNSRTSLTPSQRWFLKKIRLALIVTCLMPLLNGCGTNPIVTKLEKQRVPQSLLVPCPKSDLERNTYLGAIELAERRGLDVDECNARIEDVRKWSEQ